MDDIRQCNKFPISVILLKAEWCGYCQKLLPAFNSFKSVVENKSVAKCYVYEQTNADHEKIFFQFDPQGFPTLLVYKCKLDIFLQYNGPRTEEDMIDFVMQHYNNPYQTNLTGQEEVYNLD
jgi:thiol-disulfide isomerase/thioredoxin|eukprot:COSAG01_NODE_330_length_18723_cov_96.763155_11_plen_121_part_00